MKTIRCNLNKIMQEKKITAYRLKKDTKLSQTSVNKLIHDMAKQYDKRVLETLCEYLECELDELLVLEDTKDTLSEPPYLF